MQEMKRIEEQGMQEVQSVRCRVEEVQGVGSSVQASLREDWEAERWTDVVLVGGDGVRVAAHRLVLAASSSLLAGLLGERGEGEAVLLVPSTPGWAISLLVTTLYGDTAIDTTAPGGGSSSPPSTPPPS